MRAASRSAGRTGGGNRLRRVKAALLRLVLLLGSLGMALLLAEGLVRLAAPQQLILIRPDIWRPDDTVGWRKAGHLDTVVNTGEGAVRLMTDGAGHRIGAAHPGTAQRRILALGDSFVEALQVEYEDTMTARLGRRLSEALGNGVEVVNAGVGGWSPDHYLAQARLEFEAGPFDVLLVFVYLPNDVLPYRLERMRAREPAPRHALRLPRGLNRRELVDSLAYPVNDFLEVRSHLYTLVKNKARFLRMRLGLSPSKFPEVLLRSEADSVRWRMTGDACQTIAEVAAGHGTPTIFVLLPGVYQMNESVAQRYARSLGVDPAQLDIDQPERLLGAELAARGLTAVDATPQLRREFAAGARLYGNVDAHLAPAGHEVVAALLAPVVLDVLRAASERPRHGP